MALNQNDLKQIQTLFQQEFKKELDPVKDDIKNLKTDVSGLKKDVSSIKETVEFTKDAVINILDWTGDIYNTLEKKKLPERVEKLEKAVFPKN